MVHHIINCKYRYKGLLLTRIVVASFIIMTVNTIYGHNDILGKIIRKKTMRNVEYIMNFYYWSRLIHECKN